MPSDIDLLEAWRAGDKDAGSALLHKYAHGVHRMFRSTAFESAEDLTQRTFAACVEARDRVRDGASFRAYLFGVARKQLLRHLRTKDRDGRIDPLVESMADLGASPSQMIAGREEQRLLLDALRRIPLDMQLTIELHYWDGLTTEEVASVLGVQQGTIKSRLARAREALRVAIMDAASAPALGIATADNFDHWAAELRTKLADRTPH